MKNLIGKLDKILKNMIYFLLAISIVVCLLHLLFYDFKMGGVRWFHLDKERNIPTWYSGILFFIYGISALLTYCHEKYLNKIYLNKLKFPILWFFAGILGLLMSLDEMTILHENLLWKETRYFSDALGGAFYYFTQWQILFMPFIAVAFIMLTSLFMIRFLFFLSLLKYSLGGIGLWMIALSLEGIREALKLAYNPIYYSMEVFFEEQFEMMGCIMLITAIWKYNLEIQSNIKNYIIFNEKLKNIFKVYFYRMLTVLVIIFISIVGMIYYISNIQVESHAKIPSMFKKAGISIDKKNNHDMSDWFGLMLDSPDLKIENNYSKIAKYIINTINGKVNGDSYLKSYIDQDAYPRMISVSMSNLKINRHYFVVGIGWEEVIDQLIKKIKLSSISKSLNPKIIQFNFISQVRKLSLGEIMNSFQLKDGQGIATENKDDSILFFNELFLLKIVNWRNFRINISKLKRYITINNSETDKLFLFDTLNYVYKSPDKYIDLKSHTSKIFDQFNLDDIDSSIDLATKYLVQAIDIDGKFRYSYNPLKNKSSKKYNILRHSGSIYAMLDSYRYLKNDLLKEKINQSMLYLLNQIETVMIDNQSVLAVVEDNEIKIGGNALAVLAIAEYITVMDDNRWLPIAQKLAHFIHLSQLPNGDFIHKWRFPELSKTNFISEYYPGEAVYALIKLYHIDHNKDWLDVSRKAIDYLIHVRDVGKTIDELIHDHWLLYGINELSQYYDSDSYVNHVIKIVNSIINNQNLDMAVSTWNGSFYNPPRTTPTSTRMEGLNAAYQYLIKHAQFEICQKINRTCRWGIQFLLNQQFREEDVFYYKKPSKVLGGFPRDIINQEIRNDYVQHAVSALIGYVRSGQTETVLD